MATTSASWLTKDGDGGAAGPVKTANANRDGTGTVNTLYTGGANGSSISKISFRSAGTNVETVARIFMNNGSTNTTAANNILIAEVALPATSASQVGASPPVDIKGPDFLPAGYKVLVTIGTTVAGGWFISCTPTDY